MISVPELTAPVAEWRAYLAALVESGLTVDVDPKATKPAIIAAIEKAQTVPSDDDIALGDWLDAEDEYHEQFEAWLNAEDDFWDLTDWLAAEQQYGTDVTAWLDAENAQADEQVDPAGEVRHHFQILPG